MIRSNLVTGEVVLLAPRRSSRPMETSSVSAAHSVNANSRPCPFCPGNEEEDLEVERVPARGSGEAWRVRVTCNRFPAVPGLHEVVVVTPEHGRQAIGAKEWAESLRVARGRCGQKAGRPGVRHVSFFHNRGVRAGASLVHLHCQVLAIPVVPPLTISRLEMARERERLGERCPLCDPEGSSFAVEVSRTEHFRAVVPLAADSPYQVLLVPVAHCGSWLEVSEPVLEDLAGLLSLMLSVARESLGNPDTNFSVVSSPVGDVPEASECRQILHWYVVINFRTTQPAGFEQETHMPLNPHLPEDDAAFLNSRLEACAGGKQSTVKQL